MLLKAIMISREELNKRIFNSSRNRARRPVKDNIEFKFTAKQIENAWRKVSVDGDGRKKSRG